MTIDNFKEGMKVKLRSDLTEKNYISAGLSCIWIDFMLKDQVVTIELIRDDRFYIKEDNYSYCPQMIDHIVSMPQIDTITVNRKQAKQLIELACQPWKNRLNKELSDLIVQDTTEVSRSLYDLGMTHANLEKKDKINSILNIQEEETFHIGQRFLINSSEFILCVHECKMLQLIDLKSGLRWSKPKPVKSVIKVTRTEMNNLINLVISFEWSLIK